MDFMRLGRTELRVTRTAFGALPVQRVSTDDGVRLLRKAYDGGITFFDTARAYSDSEEKIGLALADVRDKIVIASKSGATDGAGVRAHLETSLRMLRTDYVDILQLHNAMQVYAPGQDNGVYQTLLDARQSGLIRFIGITCHRLDVARAAAASGLYDTVQFPLSFISSDADLQIIDDCRQHDLGLIAMKGLCGGLLTNIPAAFAFLRQFDNVVPIWGIQREEELAEFLAFEANPPILDDAMWADITRDRETLAADFCRACGYCLPCPAQIPIPMAARMAFLLRRAPYQGFITPEWQQQMARIKDCVDCGHCKDHCPYSLDTPRLLKAMLADYETFLTEHAPVEALSGTVPAHSARCRR